MSPHVVRPYPQNVTCYDLWLKLVHHLIYVTHAHTLMIRGREKEREVVVKREKRGIEAQVMRQQDILYE